MKWLRHRSTLRVGVIVAQPPLTRLESGQNRYSQPIGYSYIKNKTVGEHIYELYWKTIWKLYHYRKNKSI